ncbi:RNA dependent RNA polymerase [Plasmopara viticola lesion associated ourmia-like virus 64]|uniref:RNA dependent RNA polymerase n=1 Tax=Plasmopara viticola lesion associated ourmia-like virus 64 TaxID=2686536 RepID=A0ABX6FJR1_9VIRU|nr:RNA dependent RNA polymerase [Plasmopara viticola lesion associated ourmia-like virus 64]QGY72594.1 RNA dependent RNA polymerase [Plasmopara viticola lesion associated ourmia-like virus 64]
MDQASRLECGETLTTVVRSLKSAPFLVGDGCEHVDRCRLSQVRQLRSFRRVVAGLSASTESDLSSFTKRLPRVPMKSIFCKYVDGVSFWLAINSLTKEMSNLSPAAVRKYLPKGASLEARHSLSFSLSLLGKSLHGPCDCFSEYSRLGAKHRSSVERPDDVKPEYLGFVRQCAKRFFYKGWDSSYFSSATSSVVSSNACFTRLRKAFGPVKDYKSQCEYLSYVLGESDFDQVPRARFSEVLSAGKVRPLTITSSNYEVLRPLHKTLYNFLSRCPWLLRGSPTPESFPFLKNPGVFVSVDFEAATDNLSVNCAEAILGVALCQSRSIPSSVRSFALSSLRPTISYGYDVRCDGSVFNLSEVTSDLSMGQMMGSLLSFPLLCLQTFFFYLWSAGLTDLSGKELRAFTGCSVNGDDLVFKTEDPSLFFNAASETCSVINMKKTGVSPRFFNINSTLFRFKTICRSVPFLRPKQFDVDSPVSLGERVRSATCWLSPKSSLARRSFEFLMTRAAKVVKASGWSFFKCGFSGQKQESWLKRKGFIRRESSLFLNNPNETPVPAYTDPIAEPMVPLPAEWSSFSCFLEELTMIYNSWARFEKDLPSKREPFNLEKEVRKDRFDLDACLRRLAKRKALAARMGFPTTSNFPVFVRDVRFRSLKQVQRFVSRRLLERRVKLDLVPVGLLSLLGAFKNKLLSCNFPKWTVVHRVVLERVAQIFSRCAGSVCS